MMIWTPAMKYGAAGLAAEEWAEDRGRRWHAAYPMRDLEHLRAQILADLADVSDAWSVLARDPDIRDALVEIAVDAALEA
jgi:hypothetical protein